MSHRFFTSESVTEGHPDKICDQISDAVLDAILAKDPLGRVACETTASTGLIHIMGEISTKCYVDIPKIAREVIRGIGYDRAKYGRSTSTTCRRRTSLWRRRVERRRRNSDARQNFQAEPLRALPGA